MSDTGTVLYAYVYLDPANPPSEVMLQWYRRTTGSIALIGGPTTSPTEPTAQRAAGLWGLARRRPVGSVESARKPGRPGRQDCQRNGIHPYGGRATWDAAGLLNPAITNTPGTGESGGSTTNAPGTGDNTGSTNYNTTLASVSIAGKDGSVIGAKPGTFTFTRTGSTTSALSVAYSLGGTATSGIDYVSPQSGTSGSALVAAPSVTIPAGATSATLNITPTTTTGISDSKTVVASVVTNTGYAVAAPGNATLTMAGNTVSKPALQMNGASPTLSWASTNGAAYRIAFKNSLSDPAWTYTSNTLNSAGNLTSWTDTNNLPQRFYLVIQVQ